MGTSANTTLVAMKMPIKISLIVSSPLRNFLFTYPNVSCLSQRFQFA